MTAPAPPVLRLLSYNVRSLRDDPAAVARVIRASDPHVVCVQEAPRLFRWRAACAAMARRSGLVVVTGGGVAAGNLILCSLGVEVIGTRDVLLSRDRGRHRRGVAMAQLRWRERDFVVAGTHLDLEPEPRLRHVREIERELTAFVPPARPVALAGDTNDEPGSPAWLALTENRVDVFGSVGSGDGVTFTAKNPKRRIDGVFADPGLRPVSATVIDSADVHVASDHRPLLVELDLG